MKTKSKAVLGLAKLTYEGKVVKAQSIIDSMQASGNFPNAGMPISYSKLQTLITNLHNAIVQANNGTTSDTSKMHEEDKWLMLSFNLIKVHVEIISNSNPDPNTTILSSGMQVSSVLGQIGVTDLTVDAIGNGTIQIRVPRTSTDKAFCFQFATVADPTNWQNIGFSSLSKIQYANQVPGTVLYIRYASISTNGLGAFSNSKQIMVV